MCLFFKHDKKWILRHSCSLCGSVFIFLQLLADYGKELFDTCETGFMRASYFNFLSFVRSKETSPPLPCLDYSGAPVMGLLKAPLLLQSSEECFVPLKFSLAVTGSQDSGGRGVDRSGMHCTAKSQTPV